MKGITWAYHHYKSIICNNQNVFKHKLPFSYTAGMVGFLHFARTILNFWGCLCAFEQFENFVLHPGHPPTLWCPQFLAVLHYKSPHNGFNFAEHCFICAVHMAFPFARDFPGLSLYPSAFFCRSLVCVVFCDIGFGMITVKR